MAINWQLSFVVVVVGHEKISFINWEDNAVHFICSIRFFRIEIFIKKVFSVKMIANLFDSFKPSFSIVEVHKICFNFLSLFISENKNYFIIIVNWI